MSSGAETAGGLGLQNESRNATSAGLLDRRALEMDDFLRSLVLVFETKRQS